MIQVECKCKIKVFVSLLTYKRLATSAGHVNGELMGKAEYNCMTSFCLKRLTQVI